MNNKTLNDPTTSLNEVIIEFVNTGSATVNDGEVLIKDFASTATAIAASTWVAPENAKINGSAYQQTVLGVCRDRTGKGVAVGAVGECIVRGYHPAVKVASADTSAVGSILVCSGTAGKLHVMSAGASVGTGATVGNALKIKTAASTALIPMYVDVG